MKLDRTIAEAAETYDSFYLYSEAGILAQSEKLKTAFPGVSFLYSVKCNPNRHILRSVFDNGFGADAASAGGRTVYIANNNMGFIYFFYTVRFKFNRRRGIHNFTH